MFFQKLATLNVKQVTLAITISTDKIVSVSVLPKVNAQDKAITKIKQLTLTASAEELDQKFFDIIQQPMEKTSEIISNIEEYEKNLEQAQKNSQYNKDKKEKIKKTILALTECTDHKEFNALKDHQKAINLAQKVLDIDPKNKKALDIIETMKKYNKPSLFSE
ncbi:PRTRC system protein E [Tenacibaculum sp. MAR_2009_124]|uniref:PRTRC system protein E n=1 Tax=Tenacibaculum sp. MAR_2009_124 TaxID=1250059 RepID=UPI00089542C2|nr:PRTRC system protein E [Tenacibaculum sp. MAR_2009_124]SEC68072.1 PRTRC system protein E [Tenacibaculum sp. MAR_2009_124]